MAKMRKYFPWMLGLFALGVASSTAVLLAVL
jgi:hypothetical protein